MSAPLIIQRISAAVTAGQLKQVPDSAHFATVTCFADLLRPWEEMFPGVERGGDDDTRDIFNRGGLRKPQLTPCPRRSPRPLPPPLPIAASPKTISPGLFASVSGIWDYYQSQLQVDTSLLQLPFDITGLQKYLQPLVDLLDYPLFNPLEMLCEEYAPRELPHITLQLPFYTYDCEECGLVEALLSDLESVAGCMQHLHDKHGLPDTDNQLIEKVGFMALVNAYYDYPGAKTVELNRLLFSGLETFFGPVEQKYPAHMKFGQPIISGDHGYDCEITITSREDIEFCCDYARAWDRLHEILPDVYAITTNSGMETDKLIHEMCNAWRKSNGKRPVKWAPLPPGTFEHALKGSICDNPAKTALRHRYL